EHRGHVPLPARALRCDRCELVDAREAKRILATRSLRDHVREEQCHRRRQDREPPWFFEAHGTLLKRVARARCCRDSDVCRRNVLRPATKRTIAISQSASVNRTRCSLPASRTWRPIASWRAAAAA